MEISLVRISLLQFFKTFHIYLAYVFLIPTYARKTLVAVLLTLKTLLELKKKLSRYLFPFVFIVREKLLDLSKNYEKSYVIFLNKF